MRSFKIPLIPFWLVAVLVIAQFAVLLSMPLTGSLYAEEPAVVAPADPKPVEAAPAPAAEKPAEKPAKEPKEEEASKLWNPSLWEAIAGIIVLIWGLVTAWLKLKDADGTKKKITMAFEAAVQDTYTEFIRETKAKATDGKLSKEDVKKAQGMAWDKAKEILGTQGVDLGKEVIKEYGPVLVTKIVGLFKKKKD